jgi:hypothetical protein
MDAQTEPTPVQPEAEAGQSSGVQGTPPAEPALSVVHEAAPIEPTPLEIHLSQVRMGRVWKALTLLLYVQMCWIPAMTVISKLTSLLDLILPLWPYVRFHLVMPVLSLT